MLPRETILLIIAAAGLLAGCNDRPTSVAIGDACRGAGPGRLTVNGYLRLPMSNDYAEVNGRHALVIVEKENGTGTFLRAMIPMTNASEPNHIATLPGSYTYADLRIMTNTGREVSANERLAITGRIAADTKNCTLEIEKVEEPNF